MTSKLYLLSYKRQYLGYISDYPDRCKVFAFTSKPAAEQTKSRIQYEQSVCKIDSHVYRIKQTYDNKTCKKPLNKLQCCIHEHDIYDIFRDCTENNVELLMIDEIISSNNDYKLFCSCRMFAEKVNFVEKLNSLFEDR